MAQVGVEAASKKPDIKCPEDGIGASQGDVPVVSVKTSKGNLIVCGYQEDNVYSEFNIYSESKGKYSASLFQVGALKTYKIEPFDGGLNLIELIYFRGKNVAYQKLVMKCNLDNECTISKATCEGQEITPFKTDILKRIKPFYKNKKNLDESTITELSDLALTGNPDAIQIFKKNPGLQLSGSIAEIYKDTQERLNHPCSSLNNSN